MAADQLFRAIVGLYSWSTRVSFVNFSVVNSTGSHSIYPQKRTAAIAEKIHEKCDEILAPEGLEDTTIFTEISSSIVESCAYIVSRDLSRPDKPIAIYSAGPNDYSIGYRHSGTLRPAEIILYDDGSFKEIRRAESLKDYFATIPEVERYFTYQVSNDEFFEH